MIHSQMRASKACINFFKMNNQLDILNTRDLLDLGDAHPQTALLIEIYQFQLKALAKICKSDDLNAMINNFIKNESKLSEILSQVNQQDLLNSITQLKNHLYYFEGLFLFSLLTLWASILSILFTGPIWVMLGLVVTATLMTFVFGMMYCQDGNHLIDYQESLKAVQHPFFERNALYNQREIKDTLEAYNRILVNEYYENPWYFSQG